MKPFDRYAILTAHYAAQIAAEYSAAAILAECESNKEEDPDNPGELIGRCFLGSVLSIMPSGKYYMPWCTNQTRSDETRDGAFQDALEAFLEDAGMWLESGEGDPCDLFACAHFDAPEDDTENLDPTRAGGLFERLDGEAE